jgi:uncharacterized repeat protein (TIGR03803 family)
MKTTSLRNQTTVVLTALACVTLASLAPAQTYTVIKSFGVLTNVTGWHPSAPLAQAPDGTLYGTTYDGEGAAAGTVFKINSDGTAFTVLKRFTNYLEGANPLGTLVLSGSTLYGATKSGGSSGNGTVFKVNTDGSGYTVLKNCTDSDGSIPEAGLILSGSTLYGTTSSGGSSGNGAVFKVNTDGSGYTVLKNFAGGSDGEFPYAGLTLSGNTLYGTTFSGGSSDFGTVFKVNTNGSGYAVLKNFTGSDGSGPLAGLTISGSTVYGTTREGGSNNLGTVFKVNTNGSSYTVLKNFAGGSDGAGPVAGLTISGSTLFGTTGAGGSSGSGTVFQVNTNSSGYTVLKSFDGSDGAGPQADLTLSGSTLYGTTYSGGSSDFGTVFKVNTNGNGYTVLKNFAGRSDGASPYADLMLSGSTLYGTTQQGGSSGNGTVFKVSTDGSGYTVLKNFAGFDGRYPNAGVTLSGSALYGTTYYGGSSDVGTVFKVNTDGSGYTVLKNFAGGSDGANPYAGLTLSGSTLYGTTEQGGSSGGVNNVGTVFKINTDGGGYAVLKDFIDYTNGANPRAGLTLSGSTLYGTAYSGDGSTDYGTVFQVNSDGSGYTVLKKFTNSDGKRPYAGVTLSGSTLYGTTTEGSGPNLGTVFKVNTDGSGYTVLKSFTGSDGAIPYAGVTLSGSTLYGTTRDGGTNGNGTVFMVNTDGSGYTVLKNFAGGSDGANPYAGLTLSGSTLFGTTAYGGELGLGTVFKIDLPTSATPRLSVTLSNVSVVISWPSPSTGFLLQQNTNLNTTNWVTPPESVTDNSALKFIVVTNAITETQKYYRLVKP